MYLNTSLAAGSVIMTCPRSKELVGQIEYCVSNEEAPYRVSFCGCLRGLPGRFWKSLQAAEYSVLAEYINHNHR
jgi:hypothetical protein